MSLEFSRYIFWSWVMHRLEKFNSTFDLYPLHLALHKKLSSSTCSFFVQRCCYQKVGLLRQLPLYIYYNPILCAVYLYSGQFCHHRVQYWVSSTTHFFFRHIRNKCQVLLKAILWTLEFSHSWWLGFIWNFFLFFFNVTSSVMPLVRTYLARG